MFSKAARTLSNFIGVKRITRPFWDRWRASGIDDATIFRVLDGIATIDNWATVAGRVVDAEIAAFAQERAGLSREQEAPMLPCRRTAGRIS